MVADRIILVLIACLMTMGVVQAQMTYIKVTESQAKIEQNQELVLATQKILESNQEDLVVNQRAILTQIGTLDEACHNE